MHEFCLFARPPFSLELTVRALQRLPSNRVDVWLDGKYHRLLHTSRGLRLVTVEETGSVAEPSPKLSILGDAISEATAAELRATINSMLGLDVALDAFYRCASAEPALARVVGFLRGLKPPRFPSLFEALVNTVVFQQISINAALAITGRFVERFGETLAVDDRRFFAFPDPEAVATASVEDIQAVGLTRRKAEALQLLAGITASRALTLDTLADIPSDEAIEVLTALPGIGRWTAQVILLRGLGRMDVFPAGDSGAARGLARMLGREGVLSPAEIDAVLDNFGNLPGLLYFYSLGWRLIQAGVIVPK